MSQFPKLLFSQHAYDMAQVIVDGFDRYYRIFREASRNARSDFELQNWSGRRELIKGRIDYYDERVKKCILVLDEEFDTAGLNLDIWQQVKLPYIELLTNDQQMLREWKTPDHFGYSENLRFINRYTSE